MYFEGLPRVTEAQRLWGSDPSLVLVPGRLYYVAILGKDGDRALVSLGGHRFSAEVVGDLPEQGRVAVTVREATPDRVVLERAPEPQALAPHTPETPADPAHRLLARMGLPALPEFREVLPYLLRSGQPLTAANLLALQEGWGRLAGEYPDGLPLLARLQAQGLPLIPETMEAAARLESARPLLTADGLFRLAQSLLAVGSALEGEASLQRLESLPTFTRALARSLVSLPLTSAGHPTVARQVAALLSNVATPVEALLLRHHPVQGRQPALADPTLEGKQTGDLFLRNPGSAPVRLPALEENVQVQIRRLDALLDRLMEGPERLSPESREALRHCQEAVRNVLQGLDAEQIGNLRSGPDASVPHTFAFSLPIAWSGPQDEASLRVYCRRGRGQALDPRNAHLAFRLTVAPLGTVEVDLRILRDTIACDVHTADETVNRLAERAAPQLRQGLQNLGYLVRAVRCSASPRLSVQPPGTVTLAPEELALVDLVV
ncbi:MAG: flagellar hook-length control protein FliK [Anaerolineae bacterium]|jgi:hypothetical protein